MKFLMKWISFPPGFSSLMSKVTEYCSTVETALLLWVLQTTTENTESVVSAVKTMDYCLSCKSLISLFAVQTDYVKYLSVKDLVKCIS